MNDALTIYSCDNRTSLLASRLWDLNLAELARILARDSWVCYPSRYKSLPRCYIGGSSAGLDQAQRIDSSLRADWLSFFGVNGLSGAIEEGRNATIQPVCQPLVSRSDPLVDLIRAQARDYECAISPGFSISSAGYLKSDVYGDL